MTDDKIALSSLLEKSSDSSFLREMFGFAAERLMQLETGVICKAAPASAALIAKTSATANGGAADQGNERGFSGEVFHDFIRTPAT